MVWSNKNIKLHVHANSATADIAHTPPYVAPRHPVASPTTPVYSVFLCVPHAAFVCNAHKELSVLYETFSSRFYACAIHQDSSAQQQGQESSGVFKKNFIIFKKKGGGGAACSVDTAQDRSHSIGDAEMRSYKLELLASWCWFIVANSAKNTHEDEKCTQHSAVSCLFRVFLTLLAMMHSSDWSNLCKPTFITLRVIYTLAHRHAVYVLF